MDRSLNEIINGSIQLLKVLIETPSLSREEDNAALAIRNYLTENGIVYKEMLNNTWCYSAKWDDAKPVILLNSHIDTVKPVDGWTHDPFRATLEGDQLFGLGSNDAGGPLVALLAVFLYFNQKDELPFNLIFSATAEEEVSGKNGVELLVKQLDKVDLAIVGEPTKMELAVAEKGLLVVDGTAKGKAGHAARNEGINSIYLAIQDIEKIKNYKFEKVSEQLGEVKMTVTQINAGFQHNVVPDTCKFVVDVRTNECYTNDEIIEIIEKLVESEMVPRSRRLNSSGINLDHPIVARAKELGIHCFGSPTLSDQSLMDFRSVKMGPGDSARSHTANEYIYTEEISKGVQTYIRLLENLTI